MRTTSVRIPKCKCVCLTAICAAFWLFPLYLPAALAEDGAQPNPEQILEQQNEKAQEQEESSSPADGPEKTDVNKSDAEPSAPEQPVRPEIRPTRILPSKIHPVQDNSDDDAMSKAAPDVQTAQTAADLAALEALTLPPQNESFTVPKDWQDLSSQKIIKKFEKLFETAEKSDPGKKMERAEVIDLLSMVQPAPESTSDGKDGIDLYSFRLSKFLELGEMNRLLELYMVNEGEAPSSRAAHAGIISMIWKGRSGLACLDQKALPKDIRAQNQAFWSHIDLFCDALLSPASGEDEALKFTNAARIYINAVSLKAPDSLVDLNKMDPLSIMALGSTGALIPLLDKSTDFSEASDLTLVLLLGKASVGQNFERLKNEASGNRHIAGLPDRACPLDTGQEAGQDGLSSSVDTQDHNAESPCPDNQ